jgi:tetratricopeptide (TPR) repeat protein
MTGKNPVLIMLLVCLGMLPGGLYAQQKATDFMSLALKNKAAGKTNLAIDQLQKAVEKAKSTVQKNLALFMLGDCQLEAKSYTAARKTFELLRNTVAPGEEYAEATFRLLQAETFSGNSKKADRLFRELRKNNRNSPYFELASSFIKAQGLKISADSISDSVDESKEEPAPVQVLRKAVTEPKKVVATPVKTVSSKEPEKKEKTTRAFEEARPEAAVLPKRPAASTKTDLKKIPVETAGLLKDILTIRAKASKEELISKILSLQDQLKQKPQGSETDKTLFELADLTAQFGETLEACKLYDQLLSKHPTSRFVEPAYYEAIRLRAVLNVHEAVVSWAKAFLAAFPASGFTAKVKALLLYSENNGRVDLSRATVPASSVKQTKSSGSIRDDSEKLKADRDYVEASRKMKDGKYNLALIDLKNLSGKYPQASQVWWDMALVYVQFEDFVSAEKVVKKMLAISPDNEEANSLLGYIHYRLEDYHQAASAYDRAGEPGGNGVTFFDAKSAAERMKKSAGSK